MYFKAISSTMLCLAVAGCVESTGGAGLTKSGEPVAGKLALNYQTRMFDVEIQSPKGWKCTSQFEQSGQNMRIRTVPLTCSDGRRGNLVLTSNQYQGQAVGSFTLSNGESGQVTFGIM